jgi:hypothetical protein
MSSPVVLSIADWNPKQVKYMQPKVNDRGGKSITIISPQTKRSLHLSTPLMMTWGINDFVDEKGESDGKYSMSLTFPNEDYTTPALSDFLQKLKEFENQLLDDAVANCESWWGEEMSREVAKHTFFPFLKYSKNKDTKKTDYTKPPSIRAKVPFYDNKWNVEIYDTKKKLLFPCDNESLTPIDFVPKQSQVACVLQCGGVWIGGKGWGLTWKLIQCVVKPREVISVYGKCHIELSVDDQAVIDSQKIMDDADIADLEVDEQTQTQPTKEPVQTIVEDSDDDNDVPEPAPVPEPASEPEPVPEPEPEPVVEKTVKKVVKKTVVQPLIVPPEEVKEPEPVPAAAEPPKVVKKVVKKKV